MPQSTEVRNDLRIAKVHVWLDRHRMLLAAAGILVTGMAVGASSMALADRAERLDMVKRHADIEMANKRKYDDDMRDFRMNCRKTVDERDQKVLDATRAAADAARAAADAAADDAPPRPSVAVKPAAAPRTRTPPPDLNAQIRDVNKRIAQENAK